MLISREKKLLFIHIQRTGGSSIQKILNQHVADIQSFMGSHDHALWAQQHLGLTMNNYFKFAFVRNPWDRLLSWYQMILQTREGTVSKWYQQQVLKGKKQNKLWAYLFENSINFQEFLLKCTDEIDDIDGKKSFAYNQLDYLTDEHNNIIVDFIGRYENYAGDVQSLCKRLNFGKVELPHEWASNREHYSLYYTEKTQAIVAERFAKDIKYFGYKF